MTKTSAKILDGKSLRAGLEETLRRKISSLKNQHGEYFSPKLATIQIGESKDIELYFHCLERLFAKFQIPITANKFPADAAPLSDVLKIYEDKNVTGILIFSPIMADEATEKALIYNLPSEKDIEGRKSLKNPLTGVFSPTAKAVMAILKDHVKELSGKSTVVIGHSDLVGKSIALSLLDENATVTVCHKATKPADLPAYIQAADIVVAAAGKPGLIKGEWIKKGGVVIDVGENVVHGKIVGDVEFESASQNASAITPVPGGVGPLTSLMLVMNLVKLFEDKMAHGNHRTS